MKIYIVAMLLLQITTIVYSSESFTVSRVIKATANNETEEVYHGLTNMGIPIFAILDKQTGQITCGWCSNAMVYQFDVTTEKSYFSLLQKAYASSAK